ncbi:MAG: fumarate hydratase [Spirochaetae bacterium HGW-Spirochaetae-3]|jgi:fumarate hydratase class I|nr:MAG: fumarate hydratase [Spirochaetae bacterium HGW-Spirochaetae-3]
MHGSDDAFYASIRAARDGDLPVAFDRLPLDPPRAERALGRDFIMVPESALAALAERAFGDVQFRLRSSFLSQLAAVASDPGSDGRDRYAAASLLENAAIAAAGTYPVCQDTGTAAVYGWKGDGVLVDGPSGDAGALAAGALAAWKRKRLRNSQVAPLPDLGEANTGDNAPLSAHISAVRGDEYRFLFVAKGGGSSNKTALFQETKRLLAPEAFASFIASAIAGLGVSACPPYRIAVVLGGQSPEEATLAGKLASAGALDALPPRPETRGGPYRDRGLEALVMDAAARSGWGAQLGGRFLARDARVIRLPRHAASLPVVVAVSCSAHRQAYAYVSRDGYFMERLADANDVGRIVAGATIAPAAGEAAPGGFGEARRVDLGAPGTPEARAAVAGLRSGELVALWGKAVLARDAAHARLQAMIDRGEPLPDWTAYPAFYASPTETPDGAAVGSIGPTTSKRMDSYLESFGERGVFPLTIGKGERGPACRESCARHGGAYVAALGGAAALAASRYVSSCRVIDWPELGMEAIRLVELRGLPALVAVDARGEDYYAGIRDR